ncbi:MAG: helix-turn-helix domain-containing protein [Micromonosporaceae bacterium]|nr:helix-turn-helix domain-containing protein [Micromonosporaceae bacterium]
MHDNAGRAIDSVAGNEALAYSVRSAARMLDLSERKVWQLVIDGEIESVSIGRARRIPRASLVAYLERLRSAA